MESERSCARGGWAYESLDEKSQVSACNMAMTTHDVQHTCRASPLTPASVVE
jgi:hypothetical protein